MPGNTVQINRSVDLTWYVSDFRMDELMEFLDKLGERLPPESATPAKN